MGSFLACSERPLSTPVLSLHLGVDRLDCGHYILGGYDNMQRSHLGDPLGQSWGDLLAKSWKLAALLVVLSAIAIAALRTWTMTPSTVEAQLLRIGSLPSDTGDMPMLVVRLKDGTIRQFSVRPSDVHACRVGSPIRLIKRGALLTLPQNGCALR